jgi:hypothetical protein
VIVRRGMGATCASYGPLPAGYACVDSASGDAKLIPPGGSFSAVQTDSFGQVGPVDCAVAQQALAFDPTLSAILPAQCLGGASSLSSLPSWAIPAGIGLLVVVLLMGSGGRRR